jgi:aminoglycoside phosphotransferase (APT) family kinase protein
MSTHEAPRARPIPLEVEDVTAEWLTAVLQPHAPGARVDRIDRLEAHSGTTGRLRLGLHGDDPRLPTSVFVKLAPFTEERRALVDMVGMGVSEARFYAEVAPWLRVRTPAVWHADHDEAGGYVMVLEDLTAAGATQPTQDEPDSADFAARVMETLASCHAELHGSPRFAAGGDLAWIEEHGRGYGAAAALDFLRHSVETIGGGMPPVFHQLAELCIANGEQVAQLLAEGTPTLVHGDSHIGNMLRQDHTPILIDWAMVSCGPGIRDVSYFIGNSVPTEVRRENEQELLRRYLAALAERGVEIPWAEAWERYRLHMVTGWIAAVSTAGMGDALQPIEIGMRATERSNVAIEDLDVVDLLRASLG